MARPSAHEARAAGNTVDRIITAAETRVRAGGYHGFSFREIAADVGIKSASVHHHFATKEDLGAAVAKAYADRFLDALGDPQNQEKTPQELVDHYIATFRHALENDRRMCLCGVLATETDGLPRAVQTGSKEFFTRNIAWLETVLARRNPQLQPGAARAEAMSLLALLEGGMMISISLGSNDPFEAAANTARG